MHGDETIALEEMMYDEVAFEDLPLIFEFLPPQVSLAWYGPPGIGKSQLAKNHIDLQPVTIIGLAVRQAEDIGGCPMPDIEKGVTHIFPMRWFRQYSLPVEDFFQCQHCGGPVDVVIADDKKSGHIICVDDRDETAECPQKTTVLVLPKGTIVFDEFDKGTPEKQVAVMRILSERELEGFQLSPLVRIIVISNREQDNAGVFHEMPNVIKNRLIHMGVRPSYPQWERDFAIPNGIHALIMMWLKENQDKLVMFDPNSPAYGFPTPRSWEYASYILEAVDRGMPGELGRRLLVGALGRGVANEFWQFKDYVDSCPPIDELASGAKQFPPEDQPDKWVALVARCVASAEAGLRSVRKDTRVLQQVCQVLGRMPDSAINYRTMLAIWLRKRPLTRHLVLDAQAMGTDKHLAVLGDDMADMERPSKSSGGTSSASDVWG